MPEGHPQSRSSTLVVASGISFAVFFTAAFVAFADLAGSFADPNETFVEYFEKDANRARDIAGMYLLTLAGLAFAAFGTGLGRWLGSQEEPLSVLIGPATLLSAASMMLAAALLGTVSLSRTMGNFFDDTGVLTGEEVAVLPQAGTVALGIPGAIAAAATIAAASFVAWGRQALPRWICIFGFAAAPIVALLAFAGPPLLLLPAWSLAVSIAVARTRQDAQA